MTTMSELTEKYENIIAITKAKNLQEEMKSEMEKYQKLHELAYVDFVGTVIHNVNTFEWMLWINFAKNYLHTEKIDKRSQEYKENKIGFEKLTKLLSDTLGYDVEIKNVLPYGYEDYYYDIEFIIKDKEDRTFIFGFPDVSKINIRNIEYAYEGKYIIGEHVGESTTEIKESSYILETIKNTFQKMVNKE